MLGKSKRVIKCTSDIQTVPHLIRKLKEVQKVGGTVLGCHVIKIRKDAIAGLIKDLEHTDNAANTYWSMREQL